MINLSIVTIMIISNVRYTATVVAYRTRMTVRKAKNRLRGGRLRWRQQAS